MSLNLMPESLYSSATLRHVLRKSPSPSFMMLALCTQVTVCDSSLAMRGEAEGGKTHLAVVLDREIKGEARDTLRLVAGHDLETLDDTRERLYALR